MSDRAQCKLAGKFSLWEKIYAQTSFIVMGVVGATGIILEDWVWIIPYLIIYWYGVPGIVMRHLICPRCPHLYDYGDCLQASPVVTRWLIKERKTYPLSTLERYLFYFIFMAIPLYPIYWLLANKILLIAFVASSVMWYSGQYNYFCRRCRNKQCPFNRSI